VETCEAYKSGALDVGFIDGTKLVVESRTDGYEAWEITGSHGLRVVSLGNESLAIWQPHHVDHERV